MGWRLHLSNEPVVGVQLIPGEPPQVAVWDGQHNVHGYARDTAVPLGKVELAHQRAPEDLNDLAWREFVESLRAPGGGVLPTVNLNRLTLYYSRDGRMRLYHYQHGGLILEVDGRHIALDREQDGRFLAAALDRALGLVGAVNDEGKLFIFQQHMRVGAFELGLALGVDTRLSLYAPDASGTLVVGNGRRVIITDSAGRVQHELDAHYAIGPMAVAPSGQIIALADVDDNVIRLYDGRLRATHQRYAIDLVADARQVQLLASLPGRKVALTALDVADDGTLVFALGGVVCVTSREQLDVLPQPRPLL
ncbi:MAG: hypothetical protein JW910_12475 [Anaerolineae bacterium]|nr:hypothetical protein [Anaerolineae bacterium]